MMALPVQRPPSPHAGNDDGTATRPSRPYHHGDLAAALLDAGEAELAEKGVEAFSLRGVAKRAGVSHAAPAHHFGDARGLLTAIATRGFERFIARQQDFRREAPPNPRAQLEASGLGYVAFATENPALFRLMFGSDRPDFEAASLCRASRVAFEDLVQHVIAVDGPRDHPPEHAHALSSDPDCPAPPQEAGTGDASALGVLMNDVAACWAIAHGLADLLVAGRLPDLAALPPEDRARAIVGIVGRALPTGLPAKGAPGAAEPAEPAEPAQPAGVAHTP